MEDRRAKMADSSPRHCLASVGHGTSLSQPRRPAAGGCRLDRPIPPEVRDCPAGPPAIPRGPAELGHGRRRGPVRGQRAQDGCRSGAGLGVPPAGRPERPCPPAVLRGPAGHHQPQHADLRGDGRMAAPDGPARPRPAGGGALALAVEVRERINALRGLHVLEDELLGAEASQTWTGSRYSPTYTTWASPATRPPTGCAPTGTRTPAFPTTGASSCSSASPTTARPHRHCWTRWQPCPGPPPTSPSRRR